MLPPILQQLRVPVIGAPLFLISDPQLVIAQCKAGIIGSFPSLNARPSESLEAWLTEIDTADRRAPYAVNQIVHKSNQRLDHDLDVCSRFRVPIVISSLGSREDVNRAVHSYGGFVFTDVSNTLHARKAIDKGSDGLIALAAGAGGHTGTLSPFALIEEIREWFDGPLALAGAIATARSIRAALAMGADLAYVGSPFIATVEANAPPKYKQMIVESNAADIIANSELTGFLGNYLRGSVPAQPTESLKPWRDIWGAGHGIGAVKAIQTVENLVKSWLTPERV